MSSLSNALRVIEAVAVRQPAGVSDLARHLDMPKSSVQRSLVALHEAGWIRPTGTELTRWVITTKVLTIGSHAGDDFGIRPAAVPVMQALRARTAETINLTVPGEGPVVVLIERLESPQVVRTSNAVGATAPLHASSNGKAVLAHLPQAEVDSLIAAGLETFTARTIVDPATLRRELESIRVRGYATNVNEWREGTASVAAPIRDTDGRPVAALSISAPVERLPDSVRPVYGSLVHDATLEIEGALGFRRRTVGETNG